MGFWGVGVVRVGVYVWDISNCVFLVLEFRCTYLYISKAAVYFAVGCSSVVVSFSSTIHIHACASVSILFSRLLYEIVTFIVLYQVQAVRTFFNRLCFRLVWQFMIKEKVSHLFSHLVWLPLLLEKGYFLVSTIPLVQ